MVYPSCNYRLQIYHYAIRKHGSVTTVSFKIFAQILCALKLLLICGSMLRVLSSTDVGFFFNYDVLTFE